MIKKYAQMPGRHEIGESGVKAEVVGSNHMTKPLISIRGEAAVGFDQLEQFFKEVRELYKETKDRMEEERNAN